MTTGETNPMPDDYTSDPSRGTPQQHSANSLYSLRKQAAELGISGMEHANRRVVRAALESRAKQDAETAKSRTGTPPQPAIAATINAPHTVSVIGGKMAFNIVTASDKGNTNTGVVLPPYPACAAATAEYALTVVVPSCASGDPPYLTWHEIGPCA